MATPTLVLINDGGLTDGVLSDADANTGWINLTTPDTDIKVEGVASESGITRSDGEDSYYDSGGAPVSAVGLVLRGWVNTTNVPYMQPEATNPYELWCFDGSTQSNGLALFGSDTYPGGWFYFWQAMDDFTGPTLANVDRWGIEAGHSGNSKNVINMWMDILRYMDGYYLTGGGSGDKVEITDVAAVDLATAYGIVRNQFEVFFATGIVQIGNGATTTWFEMDGEVLVFLDTPGALSIAAGLYEINVQGSGCDAIITNSVLRANGTTDLTRFILDLSDTNAAVEFTSNLVTRAGAVTFASGQTATANTFDDCGVVTAAGADLTGSTVKNYEGATGTSALNWNVATDPDGLLDLMSFAKGTATTHAIEFGTSIPSEITLTGIDFSGYNAADDLDDSTLYFADTSGTITLNLVGCTGNISIDDTAGCTVVPVIDPVTTTFTVKDVNTLALIEDARVLAVAADGDGGLPFELSITSIERSGGTATVVTGSVHGMITGDIAFIEGATEDEYNGAFAIVYVNTTTFTYTVPGTPDTPAGGTKIVTGGYFNELTNASGVVTDTRSIGADQVLTGWVRQGGSSPYYKESPVSATTDATSGVTQTIFLIPDGT
jgi:hypothetical protein